MTTLNPVTAKTSQIKHQFHNHHFPILANKPVPFLSFRTPPPPSFFSIKASSQNPNNEKSLNPKIPQNPKIPKTLLSQNPYKKPQNPFFSFLKPTLIATLTAAALLFSRFIFYPPKHAISAEVPVLESVPESEAKDSVSDEEKEREIQELLVNKPDDVEALRSLMEIKIKNKKLLDAVNIIDRLIELEPNEPEWPLLKSHLYISFGEVELAKAGFNEILKKDPFRVEAYHGLVMASSQDDSSIEELKEIEKKVEEGMKMCKKENKMNDVRDFKLLLAQIRVIEGKYDEALKVYQELVKEEPRDFRPYLCQGIIYTLLRKSNEAEKCFGKYRRLVPQGHPYARYFDENMMATKVFAQNVENERAGSKS